MSRMPSPNLFDTDGPNIMGSLGGLQMPSAPVPQATTPPGMREFGDVDATRDAIYDRAFHAASTMPDVTNAKHTLRLKDVAWADPGEFSKKQRKEAILKGESLGRRLRGTWELLDNASGKTLDSKQAVIAKIPHLTEGGTFVRNGGEYALKHQQRLRSGIFAREKDNGEFESHVNVLEGGPSHRFWLNPEKGQFYAKLGQANLPLMPLLKHLGASDKEIRDTWGPELHAANYAKGGDGPATAKLVEKFLKGKIPEGMSPTAAIKAKFEGMKVDPEVTRKTLGHPHEILDKHTVLAATKKLLAISRGEAEVDDRDHLAYQHFLGPEDLFHERLAKDRGGVRRQLLFKATYKGGLNHIGSSALQKQVDSAIMESGLGQALEEINPAEILDKNTQISRMGEGGIPSYDAVPDEARAVQPSHLGFMDPLRTPESFKAGVDVFLARNARKGNDGRIYAQFKDPRTGQMTWQSPQDVADKVLTFPGQLSSTNKRIQVMKDGKMTYAKKRDVNLVLPEMEHAFSPLGNLIPLKSMVKGQRVAMASRMTTQALPLVNAESPGVQTGVPGSNGTQSYEDVHGEHMGALKAKQGGRVVAVTPDDMTVQYDDGTTKKHDLYNNFPYNRKTGITQTPLVQPGQRFNPGQTIAKSNFTDANGATAMGLNARVAYTPWGGLNYEDAIVISDAMAKRLTSEHMYQHGLELGERTRSGKKPYLSLFPAKYDKATLDRLDDDGVIKPGQEVHYGDPLIVAAEERPTAQNKVHKKGAPAFQDASVTWSHHDPGIVTDVVQGRNGPVVLVKSKHPMQVGDKMSGRYGDKGIVSAIIPDHQMPHGQDGKPFEVLLNSLGVVSRTNPAQWAEMKLGEIARKNGQPVKVEDFDERVPDRTEWVLNEMKKHGIPDLEDLMDPNTGRKIPGIATGTRFFMKLHHTAESKGQGRNGGAYTADETPAKGGETGAKRMALLDVNALLSHGATEVIRDASAIRGQRNDDYWLQFMQGNTPRKPNVPMVYNKFMNELKASGINVVRDGSQLHIMAMTPKDVNALAGERNLQHGETVKFGDDLQPIKGGLFDPEMTGGHHGTRWSAIKLHEAMPNPVMEEPIRRVLGLTQKKFEDVLQGKENLPAGGTGPKGIAEALRGINVDRELSVARSLVEHGNQGERDTAIRKLGYLKSAKRLNIHPGEWVMDRAPVLPPQFRPVSTMGKNNIPLVSDPNYLYKELIEANDNLRDMKGAVGDGGVGPERLAVYNAFKAVTGLGDPITQASQEKQVRGILKSIFGSSPKLGTVQRKLISSTTDNVGRAVVSPNPDLDMDQVALPEDRAFSVYGRFVARRLRRQGMPMTQVLDHIKDQTPLARKALTEEMDERPVIINRAPVLHKFGIMAFRPTLTKGSTLQVSPLIVKGFGMDFDGDAVQYHVPADEKAKAEALARMLPSRQLLSPADFKTPVHVAGQEYVGGIHFSTDPGAVSKRPVRTFRNKADVQRAWMSGEINVNDRIHVLES